MDSTNRKIGQEAMADAQLGRGSLGRVFSVDGRHYWYDANQNGFLTVDPVLAAVLPVFGQDNDQEVQAVLGGAHSADALRRAMAEIRQARIDEDLFVLIGPPQGLPDLAEQIAAWDTKLSHLTLCLSERCNLRCRYCTQATNGTFGQSVMSTDTALRALRWFAARCHEAPLRNVSFYGGEPLLHFDLIESVVREGRRRPDWPELRFTIDTNATLIDEPMARFIVEQGLHLQVSLDGPPELHDRYRRYRDGGATHARVLAGVRRLLTLDPAMAERISYVATLAPPYDFAGVSAYFQAFPLYREMGIVTRPYVRLNTANLDGTPIAAAATKADRAAQWQSAHSTARQRYLDALLADRRGDVPLPLADMFDDALVRWHHRRRGAPDAMHYPSGVCQPGLRRLFVAPDGTFQPCEKVGAGQRIGDLETGLDAGAVARLHRDLLSVLEDHCRRCWALRVCRVCFTAVRPDRPRAEAKAQAKQACVAVRREAAVALEGYLQLRQRSPHALAFLESTRLL